MARIQINAFTSYDLEEGEAISGQVLNLSQKIVIQNRLSTVAHNLLNLKFDATENITSIQQQAYWIGQKDMLQQLLDDSQEAEQFLNAAKSQSQGA